MSTQSFGQGATLESVPNVPNMVTAMSLDPKCTVDMRGLWCKCTSVRSKLDVQKCLICRRDAAPSVSDPGPSRGRTVRRVPSSSTYSRNSSASSTRSMIDERMAWANEERSRSLSRPAPEPASPFRESSPHHPSHEKYRNGAWEVPPLSLAETSATAVPFERFTKINDQLFRVLMEIERHLHPDEVTRLERVKQSCAEEDHDMVDSMFAVR
jgi:hypothetical protein